MHVQRSTLSHLCLSHSFPAFSAKTAALFLQGVEVPLKVAQWHPEWKSLMEAPDQLHRPRFTGHSSSSITVESSV